MLWSTKTNWASSQIPGNITSGATSTADVATFPTAAVQAVQYDAGRTLGQIAFINTSNSYSVTSATAGGKLYLYAILGSPDISLAGAGTGLTDTLTGSFVLMNSDSVLANTAASSLATLAIAGTITGPFTLGFKGNNTGNNEISAVISNNGAGNPLSIANEKSGTGGGTWIFSGANDFTGTANVVRGTFIAGREELPPDAAPKIKLMSSPISMLLLH